jgi:asparagine synthase (glutamine-hydrolysing)
LGGDEWFSGSPLSYADLARQGSFVGLARAVWADRHRDESTRVRLQLAAWALCPPGAKGMIRTLLRRTPVPAWVAPDFAARTSLADRLRSSDIRMPDFLRLSQRAFYEDVACGAYVGLLEMQERANAQAGVEERYPFHDRRVSEFSLALPESDLWGLGRYKVILRRAMATRLPAAVLQRQTSPNANLVLADMLQALGGHAFFSRLEIARRGWVNEPHVRALWQRAEQQAQHGTLGRDHWALWSVAALELWVRHASPAAHSGHLPHHSATGGQARVS